MNKDLWVISEFEDIKEYTAYTVRSYDQVNQIKPEKTGEK